MATPLKKPQMVQGVKNRLHQATVSLRTTVVVALLIIWGVMSMGVIPEQSVWDVGSVATRDVIADRSVIYEDSAATKERQDQALQNFAGVFRLTLDQFNSLTLVSIDNNFAKLKEIITAPAADTQTDAAAVDQAKVERLTKEFQFQLSEEAWRELLLYDAAHLDLLHEQAVALCSDIMGAGVRNEDLSSAKESILARIADSGAFNNTDRKVLTQVLTRIEFYPTSILDQTATQAERKKIVSDIEPVRHTVQRGQMIIGRGEVVSGAQFDAMKALGLTTDESVFLVILGVLLVVALLFTTIYIFLRYVLPPNQDRIRCYKMVLTVMTLTIMSFPLILAIQISSNPMNASLVGFLVPISAAAMMLSILTDVKVSAFTLMILSLLFGIYTDNVYFMVAGVVAGFTGIAQTRLLKKRSDLNMAALYIGGTTALTVLAYGLITGLTLKAIIIGVLFGFGNGVLSVVLTIGLLPFLETAFNVITDMTLLELSDPSNPLLKRLMQEAPGTYHHSLFVANMAESAAGAIGANGLLVRTAAYYHDIGKLKRPEFFSENQLNDENPHDRITPMLSTLIITSHVKDGVLMAKEARLPQTIIDMIAQHHGNTAVTFFYMKACETDASTTIEDFRYQQKKPQTREAAILMMADTVEAAVRSASHRLTKGQMEGFIRQLIQGKLADGQFEQCALTFKDLNDIADVFSRIMLGIYHKRVEYPVQEQLAPN